MSFTSVSHLDWSSVSVLFLKGDSLTHFEWLEMKILVQERHSTYGLFDSLQIDRCQEVLEERSQLSESANQNLVS